jgi:PadR family transcriptional regulator PadR
LKRKLYLARLRVVRKTRRPSPQTIEVLFALAEEPARWRHGYDLCRSLDLKAGTVYPILIRLAERGHVDTEWERDVPSGRPPRHLYRLSGEGAELVAELGRSDAGVVRARIESSAPATVRTAE